MVDKRQDVDIGIEPFWKSVRWPWHEALVIAVASIAIVFWLSLQQDGPSVALVVTPLATSFFLGLWALCRIAIAALRRPSKTKWTRRVKKTLLWLFFEDRPSD